jgi:ATP-binding cassette subfamily F protein uup
MDKIVDHLFVFRGDGVIEDFPGNYSDFRSYESSQMTEKREAKATQKENSPKTSWKVKVESKKRSYIEQKEFKQLEREIEKLETKKKQLELKFSNPELEGEKINELSIELGDLESTIALKTERWFKLSSIEES